LVALALDVTLAVCVGTGVCVIVRDGVPVGVVVEVTSDVGDAVTEAVRLGVEVSDAVLEPALAMRRNLWCWTW